MSDALGSPELARALKAILRLGAPSSVPAETTTDPLCIGTCCFKPAGHTGGCGPAEAGILDPSRNVDTELANAARPAGWVCCEINTVCVDCPRGPVKVDDILAAVAKTPLRFSDAERALASALSDARARADALERERDHLLRMKASVREVRVIDPAEWSRIQQQVEALPRLGLSIEAEADRSGVRRLHGMMEPMPKGRFLDRSAVLSLIRRSPETPEEPNG